MPLPTPPKIFFAANDHRATLNAIADKIIRYARPRLRSQPDRHQRIVEKVRGDQPAKVVGVEEVVAGEERVQRHFGAEVGDDFGRCIVAPDVTVDVGGD